MEKQTKMIKFMIFILLLVPIVLFVIGISQTFILKSKNNELELNNKKLYSAQQKKEETEDSLDYIESDQFLEDYNKYENGKSENENDIIIDFNDDIILD